MSKKYRRIKKERSLEREREERNIGKRKSTKPPVTGLATPQRWEKSPTPTDKREFKLVPEWESATGHEASRVAREVKEKTCSEQAQQNIKENKRD